MAISLNTKVLFMTKANSLSGMIGNKNGDVLVGCELHENFSKHIGKLVCRHGAKPCNKETELLGTLKASITTT